MASHSELVLLTGATGYLGSNVLIQLLRAGYPVRCAVRSPTKKAILLACPSIKALDGANTRLSWIMVDEMDTPGAYEKAMEGATYVIHVASPTQLSEEYPPTPENFERFFVKPAVAGTLGLLESARKTASIKRVVITSSSAAIIPFEDGADSASQGVLNAESRIEASKGPYTYQYAAYKASKAMALNESEAYMKREAPRFDLISIIPTWIFGRDELVTRHDIFASLGTANATLLAPLLGHKNDVAMNACFIYIGDIAKMHVLALDPKVPGNQAFVGSSDGIGNTRWEDMFDIVKEEFPEAVAGGRLPLGGTQPTTVIPLDASKSEQVLGIKFVPFREQLKEVVGQYLELLTKA